MKVKFVQLFSDCGVCDLCGGALIVYDLGSQFVKLVFQ